MSHENYGAVVDAEGNPIVPVTGGTSPYMIALIVGGALLAIMQGFFVTGSSPFGHVWPADKSVSVQLPPFNP
jgi:hypothetical protein